MFELGTNDTRALRLSSGQFGFNNLDTIRDIEGDDWSIKGLTYAAEVSSEICIPETNNTAAIYFTTGFTIKCNRDVPSTLQHENLFFEQDKINKCHFHATAISGGGCPTFEYAGFMQYMMGNPLIIAFGLIAFGIAACFFGGYLFEYVVGSLAGIVTFFIVCMIAQAIGCFGALEAKAKLGFGNVFVTILAFVVAAASAVALGWFVKRTSSIAMGILGSIGGFFVSVLVYGFVFAKFATSAAWLVFIVMLIGTIGGGYLAFKFDQAIQVQLTATVGAYTIIRGLSLIFGGYINEFDIMSEMSSGNFVLPNTFYAYLAGFVALTVGGTFFQWHKNYHKIVNVSKGENDEHFLPK